MSNKTRLTNDGEIRRRRMLDDLLGEVDLHQQRRQSRRTRTRLALIVLTFVVVGRFAWEVLPKKEHLSKFANSVTNELIDDETVENKAALRKYISIEPDRPHVKNHLVIDHQPELEFESISDQELLSLMELTGNPSVLGKIDGHLTLIPAKISHSTSIH